MKALFLLLVPYFYLLADAKIFLYHRFGDDRYPSTNTSIEELRKEFEYFKNNNYEVVSLEKLVQRKKEGLSVPSNWIALTIDDAYKSFYNNALPIFKEYNYPFTLYAYIKASKDGFNDFMSFDELIETKKYGDIQLHGYDHLNLTKIPKEEVYADTKKGIELFQKYLGYKPNSYAYPYGEYNEEVQQTISSFGFDTIMNQNNGSINSNSSLLNMDRIALVGNVNIKEKLRYKTLNAEIIEPKEYPEDKILKRVVAKVDPNIKVAKLYVSGDAWRDVKVVNGKIDEVVNIPLKLNRIRVIVGKTHYNIATKLLIK